MAKKNRFRGPEYEEHQIEDENGKLIGHIRIKPSGILWKKSDGKKWYRVPMDFFVGWILQNGDLVKQ